MNRRYREAVILIVEDDCTTFQLAEIMFKRANISTRLIRAISGNEALDFLYKRNGFEDSPTPDIIYLDSYMPGLRGTEVLEVIHNDPILSKIPTLMLTGDDNDSTMEVAAEYGAVGYVMKPLTIDKIMETYLYNDKIRIQFVVEDV